MSSDWIYAAAQHRWLRLLLALLVCLALALGSGFLLGEFGPLIASLALVAAALGLWMLRDIEVALWSVIGIIALLPFASFPFDIGFTPTLLDAALGAAFFVWAFQVATSGRRTFVGTSLGGPVVVFVMLAMGSFLVGLSHAPLTPYLLRHFAEVILSLALFFLIVNVVTDVGQLRRIVRVLLLAITAAAVVGILLYLVAAFISEDLVIRALSVLGRLDYPTGPGVLRYVREDPEQLMRATSTSVDPNVLGSLLTVGVAIAAPHLWAEQSVIRHRYLIPMVGAMTLCLGLTISRGALVSVAFSLAFIATLRYPKLWGMLLIASLLLLILPQTQDYIAHFLQGLRGEDLATQMRFGEYKDALILIRRYPWLGVGFAGSPDIDTYVGVSNVYLLIAEEMGLIGLTSFLVIIVAFFARFFRVRQMDRGGDVDPLFWGLHAAIVGSLVGGIFDHYIFNLDFHHSVTLFWLVLGLATAATEILLRRGKS